MSRDWQAWFGSKQSFIMGILNLTPDSFYESSRYNSQDLISLAQKAVEMQNQGADIIDLGAESSRPGAQYVDEATELARILPAIQAIRSFVSLPISVDTRKAAVAKAALEAGADIINDISAARDDAGMLLVAKEYDCPLILMHMQGNPLTMQASPVYANVVSEILGFLTERALQAQNVGVNTIIVDPGIGFGKRQEDNLAVLAGLPQFAKLGFPVLIGHSRKAFIGSALARSDEHGTKKPKPAEERLAGSLAVSLWCAKHGAKILRVHDVAETADALAMTVLLDGSHA